MSDRAPHRPSSARRPLPSARRFVWGEAEPADADQGTSWSTPYRNRELRWDDAATTALPALRLGPGPQDEPGSALGLEADVEDAPARPGGAPGGEEPSANRKLIASTGSIAIATLISRITGFIKQVLLVTVLGPAVASAFTVAAQLPNMISEFVLGAVLTAIVVPVLVRAEREDPDRGEAFVRRLFTASATLLGAAAVIATICSPLLVRLMLSDDGKVSTTLATMLGYLLLPAIVFYGLSALLTAVLNTRGFFKPGAWAPVLNNLVVLVVLALYVLLPGERTLNLQGMGQPRLLLLGLGVTAGVVVQAASLLPAIRREGISLRPLWGFDARLRQFGGMAAAIVLYVAISQAGMFIATRISGMYDEAGPTIYNNAWLLLQLPYGVLGVTVLTAIMPRLSRNAAAEDIPAVIDDLSVATRLTMVALIPIVALMTLAGPDIGQALYAYGNFGAADADRLGQAVSWSAFTLIPYSLVLIHLRVFYAREQAWTPTWIVLGITGVKVFFSVIAPWAAADDNQVVLTLGLANGLGYVAGAVIGAWLLHRALGKLRTSGVTTTVTKITAASAAGVLVAATFNAIADLGGLGAGPIALLRVVLTSVVMLGVTVAVAWVLKVPEVVAGQVAIGRLLRRVLRRPATDEPTTPATAGAPASRPTSAAAARPPVPGPEPAPEQLSYPDEQPGARSAPVTPPVHTPWEAPPVDPLSPATPGGPLRGPRLVPGASVAGGRYRLLKQHGGAGTAAEPMEFWQALDVRLGREVALTFVDPEQRAVGGAVAGEVSEPQEVLSRTQRLGRITAPGLARVFDVVRSSSGGIVVSEWTPGRSLAEAAAGTDGQLPAPAAAARAVQTLAAAAEAAHRAGSALAIDHPDRIRIDQNGEAVLAFPGTPASATQASDVHGLGAVLYALLTDRWPLPGPDGQDVVGGLAPAQFEQGVPVDPRGLRPDVPFEIAAVARRAVAGDGVRTAATVAHILEQSVVAGERTELIPVLRLSQVAAEQSLGDPVAAAAEKAHSNRMLAAFGAVAGVTIIALIVFALWLSNFLGGSSGNGIDAGGLGLTTPAEAGENESGQGTTPSTAAAAPVTVRPTGATVFSPQGTPDDPAGARFAIDGNPATMWQTDVYYQPFPALKSGVGLMITLPNPTALQSVRITSPSAGSVVEIRAADAADTTLARTRVIGTGTVGGTTTDIPISATEPTTTVLVWITQLGQGSGGGRTSIAEVSFTGR